MGSGYGAERVELLQPPGRAVVRLRFWGTLLGRPTRWEATFMSCAHAGASRCFIRVGDEGPLGRELQVALPVREVDLPTIRKTVIMIRNWRRLAPGCHEFGEALGA